MSKHAWARIAVIVLTLVMASVSLTDVPQFISFQGKLYDSEGNPLNGKYEITFRMYDVEEGGTALWTEKDSVSCEEGLYHIILGLTTLLNLGFDGQYWLEVQVTGDDELSPRYRLVSVPTAFRAQMANQVSWTNLIDVPAGFADGTDDVGAAGGVSQINSGTGVSVTNPTGPTVTVAADIGTNADQVAAGDHNHDGEYVGRGEVGSVSGEMIADGGVTDADVSGAAGIQPGKIHGTAWTSYNDGPGSGLDADRLGGKRAGNGSGDIPISNGTVNTNLNADMLDGMDASDFQGIDNDWGRSGVAENLYEGTTQLTDKYVNETGPETMTGNSSSPVLSATNSGSGSGISSYSTSGSAVFAQNNNTGNFGFLGSTYYGVYGQDGDYGNFGCLGGSLYGVEGRYGNNGNWAGIGGEYQAVKGVNSSSGNYGTIGGSDHGVEGHHDNTGNYGYLGTSTQGVFGYSSSGWAGYFYGKTYMKNDVGIGTTSPGYRLEVKSSGTGDGMQVTSSDGYRLFRVRQATGGHAGLYVCNASGDDAVVIGGDGDTYFNGGDVGIGTDSPNYKLDVRGSIGNNTTLYHSDLRWKKNIHDLPDALNTVKKLRGVGYEWRRDDYADMNFSEGEKVGFIAQEVEQVLPALVTTDEDGYKNLEYAKLTAVLVEAIKEQQAQIETLKVENDTLREDIMNIRRLLKR